jgi:RND family efflux transporter MFP subunit
LAAFIPRRPWPATLLLAFLTGCFEEPAPPPPAAAQTADPGGSPLTVVLEPWPAVVSVQGSLFGDEQAVVGTKVAGPVASVNVDIGSVVRKGDVLASLRIEEFELRVRHAEAQVQSLRAKVGLKPGADDAKLDRTKAPPVRLERTMLDDAKAKVDRARSLQGQRAIPAEEVQTLEAALRVAEAKYDSSLNLVEEQIALLGVAKQDLGLAIQARDDATIRAPFDGTVQQRLVAPGVFLQVGTPVVTLVRTDPLRFRAGVPEREALKVAVGQAVRVHIEGMREPVVGTVTRIAPALEMNSRSLTIEADVPNSGGKLRAGLFAHGDVVVDPAAKAVVVPKTAVTEFAGVEKVWVVEKGQPREARLRTGRRESERLEVLDGVKPGDVILAAPRHDTTASGGR